MWEFEFRALSRREAGGGGDSGVLNQKMEIIYSKWIRVGNVSINGFKRNYALPARIRAVRPVPIQTMGL